MKKLMLSLPLAFFAALALTSSGAGSTQQVEQLAMCEEVVPSAPEELMCGRCGDGSCVASCGETATNCPKDCGVAY
jgi:hypothetical protein